MSGIGARDESNKPVDWWFLYKVARASVTGPGVHVDGTQYIYLDSNGAAAGKKPALSKNGVATGGALFNTLAQLYGQDANKDLGWFFYNDEDPTKPSANGVRGHTKGVLAFAPAANAAFWLVSSTPKFPAKAHPQGKYLYPDSGEVMGQTLLCVTLADAATAERIAAQMVEAQQPNVYDQSAVPAALAGTPTDPRVLLLQNKVATPTHDAVLIPFLSLAGQKFQSIAKSKRCSVDFENGQLPKVDFYNDIVGPALKSDLDVETWIDTPKVPGPGDSDKIHKVVEMHGVNLAPLGTPISWPVAEDHAKLAISDKVESAPHWVCVGDINFTDSMETRGGGTVAFQCEPLWQGLSACLVSAGLPPKRAAAVAASRAAASEAAASPAGSPKRKATAQRTAALTTRAAGKPPAGSKAGKRKD